MKKILISALVLCLSVASVAQISMNKAVLHFKSGEKQEVLCSDLDSITFEKTVDYDLEMHATYQRSFYLGSGQYCVHLSDKPLNDNGLPTEVGQIMFRFLAIAPKPTTEIEMIALPEGIYPASDTGAEYTIYRTDFDYFLDCIMGCLGFDASGNPTGWARDFADCTVEVSYKGDNCTVAYYGDLITESDEEPYKKVCCIYNGPKIECINEDAAKYDKLSKDVTLVPTDFTGLYYGQGVYTLTYSNTPIDEEGYVAGAGEHLNLELITYYSAETMTVSDLVGTYSVHPITSTTGPTQQSFISGVYTKNPDQGTYMPMGTYYTTYDANGYSTKMYGLAVDGTVTISISGTDIKVVGDIITESGNHVKINYASPVTNIYDVTSQSQTVAPRKSRRAKQTQQVLPSHRQAVQLVKLP